MKYEPQYHPCLRILGIYVSNNKKNGKGEPQNKMILNIELIIYLRDLVDIMRFNYIFLYITGVANGYNILKLYLH